MGGYPAGADDVGRMDGEQHMIYEKPKVYNTVDDLLADQTAKQED